MVEVVVQYGVEVPELPSQSQFSNWVTAVMQDYPQQSEATCTVRVVDRAEMQDLNHRYRNKNQPTNVLSFPFEMPEVADMPVILGDIALCAEVVQEEARTQQKALHEHWAHLVIHGVLHLLGYDHMNDAQAQEMEQLEIKYLADFGIANPYEQG